MKTVPWAMPWKPSLKLWLTDKKTGKDDYLKLSWSDHVQLCQDVNQEIKNQPMALSFSSPSTSS